MQVWHSSLSIGPSSSAPKLCFQMACQPHRHGDYSQCGIGIARSRENRATRDIEFPDAENLTVAVYNTSTGRARHPCCADVVKAVRKLAFPIVPRFIEPRFRLDLR